MKNVSLFILLTFSGLSVNLSKAQVISSAPDFMVASTYKAVYLDYMDQLSSKIFSGELEVFTDPSLTNPLPPVDRGSYMAVAFEAELYDDITGDFLIQEIHDTLRGKNWVGIHFDLNYIAIQVSDIKWLYVPNKEKTKLNKQHNLLLEKLQSETRLDLINVDNIGKEAYQVYDAMQKRIYDAIVAGNVPIYRTDSIDLVMNLAHFDTAYDYTDISWEEGWGDDFGQTVRFNFDAGSVTGTGLQGSFVETSDGWHFETSHYSLTYNPLISGTELPPQAVCWIKREDLNRFLKPDDRLLFQEIWKFTLRKKIHHPLNADAF